MSVVREIAVKVRAMFANREFVNLVVHLARPAFLESAAKD